MSLLQISRMLQSWYVFVLNIFFSDFRPSFLVSPCPQQQGVMGCPRRRISRGRFLSEHTRCIQRRQRMGRENARVVGRVCIFRILAIVLTSGYRQVFGVSLQAKDNSQCSNRPSGRSRLAEQRAARQAAQAAPGSSSQLSS